MKHRVDRLLLCLWLVDIRTRDRSKIIIVTALLLIWLFLHAVPHVICSS